jgi:Cu-processing system permease protein
MNSVMRPIGAVWRAATLEFIRSRLYVGFLAAGVLLVLASLTLAELSVGEMVNSLVDIGLAFIALVAATLAGAVTVTSVSAAIQSRELIVQLARPVSRDVFVVGRLLAVMTLVVCANLVLGGILAGLVWLEDGPALRTFAASLMVSFEGFIVAAIALAFALRMPTVGAATLTVVLFIMGRMDTAFAGLIAKGTFGALSGFMQILHHLLPQLSRFDLTAWVHGEAPGAVLFAGAYGLLYVIGVAALGSVLFARRDLL